MGLIKSDAYVQVPGKGEMGLRGMWRVKQWACDLSGAGRGATVQYGVDWDQQKFPTSPPGVSVALYYAFTPYYAGSRMQGPTFFVDAWPGGSVRFPGGNVTIEAYVSGTISWIPDPPIIWHWSAVSEMVPATKLPTYTEWPYSIAASTIIPIQPIPHRARTVHVHLHDATYSTGTWYEYAIDGSTRIVAQVFPGQTGANTGDIPISGRSHYFRMGNTNTVQKEATLIWTLEA